MSPAHEFAGLCSKSPYKWMCERLLQWPPCLLLYDSTPHAVLLTFFLCIRVSSGPSFIHNGIWYWPHLKIIWTAIQKKSDLIYKLELSANVCRVNIAQYRPAAVHSNSGTAASIKSCINKSLWRFNSMCYWIDSEWIVHSTFSTVMQ